MIAALRYHLDDLGAYQFEWLMQVLLKAHVSLGVESWGGSHDAGKDAFFAGPLRFPSNELCSGVFIFQAKFVQQANAAGAKTEDAVLKAVRAERTRIEERQEKGQWVPPRHYAFYTNAPLDPVMRDKIKAIFAKVLPQCGISAFGGNDVCDLLDLDPVVRRSFPQLLGLRDLDALIGEALQKPQREKSQAALQQARDVAPIFVPTAAYAKAWDVLVRHNFVVLEGPPEMGKTAIAWMLALHHIIDGWEAIVCNDPNEIFGAYQKGIKQIFIADDAFGRTEYDTSRGRRWEQELPRVLRILNSTHWLIWTSRKHVLERALKTMDLEHPADGFPKSREVLVDASDLSVRDRALILYRHARAAHIEERQKTLIRDEAVSIVHDANFTPERIRRFVSEVLPELEIPDRKPRLDLRGRPSVHKKVLEAIRNPTKRMRRSFEALPASDKWFLIALLEAGYAPTLEVLRERYNAHCPATEKRPIDDLLDELQESFVKVVERTQDVIIAGEVKQRTITTVDWIHPSYRDLVIDELVSSPPSRESFLAAMDVPGVVLALSDAGGGMGDRKLPLMVDGRAFDLLRESLERLVSTTTVGGVFEIVGALTDAVARKGAHHATLCRFLRDVLMRASIRWTQEEAVLDPSQIRQFADATLLCVPLVPLPALDPSWSTCTNKLCDQLRNSYYFRWRKTVEDWSHLVHDIVQTEPRFLRLIGFPSDSEHQELISEIARGFIAMAADDLEVGSPDDCEQEISDLKADTENLERIISVLPRELAAELQAVFDPIEQRISRLQSAAESLENIEYEGPLPTVPQNEHFDIENLFKDL